MVWHSAAWIGVFSVFWCISCIKEWFYLYYTDFFTSFIVAFPAIYAHFLPNRKYRMYRVIIVWKPKISCIIVWTQKKDIAQGWAGPGQLGKVMGEIPRALSVTVVRTNALCHSERHSQLGQGGGAASEAGFWPCVVSQGLFQSRTSFPFWFPLCFSSN